MNGWVATACKLTEQVIPVIVLAPNLKRPLPQPEGKSWWVLDDPFWIAEAHEGALRVAGGPPNLGMLLGWEKASPVCAVDLDLHHNAQAVDQARELGVSSKDPVWVSRTGRGGFHVYYRLPHEFDCKRNTAAAAQDGSGIDLLVNGYAVVAPSNTSKEPQGGGPYQWVTGHSPFDLTLVDLPHPPGPLIQWWRERLGRVGQSMLSQGRENASRLDVDRVLAGVPEGERNETLFRYASSLRARGVHRSEAEALVLQASARCSPPFPQHEALLCLESAYSRYADGKQAPLWSGPSVRAGEDLL